MLKLAYGQHPALSWIPYISWTVKSCTCIISTQNFDLTIFLHSNGTISSSPDLVDSFFFRKIKFGWFSPQRSLGMYVPLPLPSSSYHHCETNQNHICPKPLMALTILTQQFSLLLKPKICPAKLFEVYCNWKFILLVEGFHLFKFGLPFSSTIWSPNFNAWASSWTPKVAVVQGNRLKNKSTYKSTLELKLYRQNFLSLFFLKIAPNE